jgi:hypothetical protein
MIRRIANDVLCTWTSDKTTPQKQHLLLRLILGNKSVPSEYGSDVLSVLQKGTGKLGKIESGRVKSSVIIPGILDLANRGP